MSKIKKGKKSKKVRRQMLSFAFLADLESSKKIKSIEKEESNAGKLIKTFLKSPGCIQGLGTWKLSQNPVIYATQPPNAKKGLVAENTTVILNNKDETAFIIGVAGTNFISTYDWFIEDLEVETQIPWNTEIVNYNTPNYNPNGSTSQGYVSKSTAIALSNVWNKKNAKGKTAIELLTASLPKKSKKTITISVTGHSLGGAISPALAQALQDNQEIWNPNKLKVSIVTYIFAGPTPGDEDWVNYVKNSLGTSNVSSTYNKNDIVPHAWDLSMISEMRTLFAPNLEPADCSAYGKIVDTLIDWIYSKSNNAKHPYKRWGNPDDGLLDFEKRFNGVLPGAGLYSAISTEARELVAAISFDWTKSFLNPKVSNLNVLDAICTICGIDTTLDTETKITKADPYMLYFCQFIAILGEEHINQYHTWIKNPFLICSMRYYLKMDTTNVSFESKNGIGVIYKLFLTLESYVANK